MNAAVLRDCLKKWSPDAVVLFLARHRWELGKTPWSMVICFHDLIEVQDIPRYQANLWRKLISLGHWPIIQNDVVDNFLGSHSVHRRAGQKKVRCRDVEKKQRVTIESFLQHMGSLMDSFQVPFSYSKDSENLSLKTKKHMEVHCRSCILINFTFPAKIT